MENPSNFENLLRGEHKKFVDYLEDLHITHNKENITKEFIEKVEALQKFSFSNKNQFFVVFDQVKFRPIYVSDNIVNRLGYTPQELYDMTVFQGIKRLYWKQIPALLQLHVIGQSFRKLSKSSTIKHEVFFCGVRWKDKWGNLITFLGKQKILAVDKNREPILSFLLIEDITPIYKSDFAWCQIADFSKDIPLIRVYTTQGNTSNQLLSNRELDILKLISQKMDSASIASELNISAETVKKHRKNMLAKVGVKDMTGLVYICQQVNLI